MKWKWSNVPIPEAHLIGFLGGISVQIFYPLGLTSRVWVRILLGPPILVAGILLAGWAVWTAGSLELAAPARVLTQGPYAYSRNPMYVGWTGLVLGAALLLNNLWLLVILMLVVLYTHYFIILREEQFLKRKFGREYEQYQKQVRRYL